MSIETLLKKAENYSIDPLCTSQGQVTVEDRLALLKNISYTVDEYDFLLGIEEKNQKLGENLGFFEKSDYDAAFFLVNLVDPKQDSNWLSYRQDHLSLVYDIISLPTKFSSKNQYVNFVGSCFYYSGVSEFNESYENVISNFTKLFVLSTENELAFKKIYDSLKQIVPFVDKGNYQEITNIINDNYLYSLQ